MSAGCHVLKKDRLKQLEKELQATKIALAEA
jgi:hypothetical protein